MLDDLETGNSRQFIKQKGEGMSVNPYFCKGCIHNADKESAKTWRGCNHPEAVENAGKFFGKKDIINNRIWCYIKNN